MKKINKYAMINRTYQKNGYEEIRGFMLKESRQSIILWRENIMNITKNTEGKTLNIALEGRLDTTTAPQLEAEFKQSIADNTELILDFANLEYLSSAGLRVLLAAQKTMNKQGKMIIRNLNDVIAEVFEVTGFADILTIE